jgi:hypothetical protein
MADDFQAGQRAHLEDPRHPDVAAGWNMAAIVALVAGGVAAVGAVLLWCGISPGFVSARESGFDKLENHVKYFGPLVLLCWSASIFARPKLPVLLLTALCTLVYLVGFLAVK